MMRPRLAKSWKRDLRAHSIKVMLIGGVFAAGEAVVPLFIGTTLVSPTVFAIIMAVTFFGAFVTRLMAQKGFDDGE
jgi:hypothetical protein